MSRIEEIKGQRSVGALTAAQPRRKAVATTLATCPPGQWVSIDELFSRMRRRQPQPTVARNPWKLYIGDPQYGSLGYDGFHRVVPPGRPLHPVRAVRIRRNARSVRLGATPSPRAPATTTTTNWGIDDLDQLSRYDGLRAVRLNPLGAFALGLTRAYGPQPIRRDGPALKVLPNLDIVITGRRDRPIGCFWTPTPGAAPTGCGRLPPTRCWPRSTTGRQLTELSRFLRDRTPHALPSTVTTLLADVTARSTGLRDLGMVRLVACSDPALTTLITRDHKLRRLCSPVGDYHLAVPVTQESDFRRALRSLGYVLPTGSGHDHPMVSRHRDQRGCSVSVTLVGVTQMMASSPGAGSSTGCLDVDSDGRFARRSSTRIRVPFPGRIGPEFADAGTLCDH